MAFALVNLMVLPSVDPEPWRGYATDPRVLAYLGDEFRSAGGVQLGFAIFSVIVTVRWFRAGDPWAWAVLWVYPLLFAWQAVTTWAIGLWIVLCVVAVAALLVSRPRLHFGSETTVS